MAARTDPTPLTVPPGLRTTHHLHHAITTWSTCQRATTLLQYDDVPDFDLTCHALVDGLQLRCAPCHQRRHQAGVAA